MDANIKGQILNNYLTQQMMAMDDGSASESGGSANHVQNMDLPDSHNLDEFKNQVKMWIEFDNQVKKLQALVKERNALKNQLTVKILGFMSKYNIEDLNTKDGKLRFKQSTTKRNANLKEIKTRLQEHFGNVSSIDELTTKVFEPKMEQRQYLRRLKPNGRG